jgi:serine/threonine-protein kinase
MAFQGGAKDEGTALAVSRDGQRLVYMAAMGATTRLMLRAFGEPEFRALDGTEGAYAPFFSPDGRTIAYFAHGQLRKIRLDDRQIVTLADVRQPVGGVWATTDEILVSDSRGLVAISGATGKSTPTAARCEDAARPCWLPQPLPNSEWVLVSSYGDVAVVSRRTGERRVVLDSLFEPQARLLPNGDIAYFHRPGQLFVIGFDHGTLSVRGAPTAVLDGVRHGSVGGQFAVADDGTLVFAAGRHFIESRFAWVERGAETMLPFAAESFGVFNVSPDGRYIASTVYRTNPQIWIYDLARGTSRPIVTEGAAEHPVWSPDGREVAFVVGARTTSAPSVRVVPAEGGAARPLVTPGGYPFSWTRDGRLSLVRTNRDATRSDVWIADVTAGSTPGGTQSEFPAGGVDDAPVFSPDGKYIAYMSAITDRWEIYVQPVPATGEKWVVSRDGGLFPRWSPSGRELYFMRDRALYAVDVSRGPATAAPPRRRERAHGGGRHAPLGAPQ